MGHTLSAAIRPPFIGSFCRSVPNYEYDESQHSRPHSPSIHILDDDSLLHIFSLCRPIILYKDEDDSCRVTLGDEWVRERWWYKFTHVCRRWRYLVLGSASHLGLCLVCTYGTPVADMLAHSPPLPLIIDHLDEARKFTANDEKGVMLALQHRDRIRRIRLRMPIQNLQKVLRAIDDEFSTLEYMYIKRPSKLDTCLVLPKTFQAPRLRHLILGDFAIPIRSPLLTPAVGLVTLFLQWIHPSAYFHPNDLLQRLSLMPQLEVLGIGFRSPVPNREVEMQLLDSPTTTHATLPNLRGFAFEGVSAFLEALLPRMITPLLEKLEIIFSNQFTFFVPHLLQFISTRENFQFRSAAFLFSPWALTMVLYPHYGAKMYTLGMKVLCTRLDWQAVFAAQIFDALRTAFSAVEHITLQYRSGFTPLEDWQNAVDRTQWRELLRSFGNVKTLLVVQNCLVTKVSHSLRPDDEESPMELLPELKDLKYTGRADNGDDVFTSFINAREKAGHPVTLTRI
ncbi:hypothetical protein BJV74DRAFT_887302 [Russula compacta]|nr:hypothetical protein BJV74DRAFT_887302 [Russula compacta]